MKTSFYYSHCLNVILFAPQLLSVQSLRQQENANQPIIAWPHVCPPIWILEWLSGLKSNGEKTLFYWFVYQVC